MYDYAGAQESGRLVGDGEMNVAQIIKYSIIILLVITAVYLVYLLLAEKKKTDRLNKKYY